MHHEADQFTEGQEVILTLKDSYVLKGGLANEDNDEEDVLENIHIRDREKHLKNEENKIRKPRYDVYDESAKLLPQYDDEKQKEGIRLDPNSQQGLDESVERAKKQAEMREKLGDLVEELQGGKKKAYDLNTETRIATDYKEVKFRKKKPKKGGAKGDKGKSGEEDDHRKHTRKATIDELFPEPEPSDAAALAERAADHASRSVQRPSAEDDAKRKQALKDASYLRALNKAELATAKLMEVASTAFEEEEDIELQNSLERARRLKQEHKRGEVSIAEVAANARKLTQAAQRAKVEDPDAMVDVDESESGGSSSSSTVKSEAAGGEQTSADGSIVFTQTTEFCRGLESQTREQARARAEAAAVAAEREAARVRVKKERMDLSADNEDDEDVKEPRVKKEKLSHPSSSSSSSKDPNGVVAMDVDEDREHDSDDEHQVGLACLGLNV